jgi:hypothetical protein
MTYSSRRLLSSNHGTISAAVASTVYGNGQVSSNVFSVLKIMGTTSCILDPPALTYRGTKVRCGAMCSALQGCDFFNYLYSGAVNSDVVCQLFDGPPILTGTVKGCTGFYVSTMNNSEVANSLFDDVLSTYCTCLSKSKMQFINCTYSFRAIPKGCVSNTSSCVLHCCLNLNLVTC